MRGLSTVPREACSQASTPGPLGELRSPAPRRPRSSERRGRPLELPSGNTGLCFHLVPAERRGSFPPRVPVSFGTVPRHSEHSVKAFDNEAHLTTVISRESTARGRTRDFLHGRRQGLISHGHGTVGFRFCVDTFTSQLESVPGDTADALPSPCSRPAPSVPFPRSPCHSQELNWPSIGQNPEQSLACVSPLGGVTALPRRSPVLAPSRGPPQVPQAQPF